MKILRNKIKNAPPQYQPNIIWILLLLFTLSTTNLMAQTLVNKDWATPSVHPLVLDWYSSTVDASGQVINVGNTTVSGQGTDIAIQKVDNDGNVVWQRIYNSSNNQNDVGIAVTTDFDDNIYICGMTNVNNQQDVLVVKYNRDGVFQWVNQYNNAANGNDVATTLKTDTWGNVYVAAVSETPTTASDFLLLKLNTNGVLLWQKRYDYAGLFEIPAALAFDNNNNVLIVGASASDFTNWDYTIVKYTPEGILQNVVRNNAAGAGFDQPVAAKRDPSGNFYVVGKASSDGVNYNIKTVKFNPDLSLAWVRTYDASGREDAAKDLAIDDDGNVVVAGYSTKSNGLKEITLIKYNTDGNTEWIHKQAAKDDSGDAIAKSLDIDDDGKVYFLAEEKGTANSKDVVAMKLNTNGAVEWSQHLNTSADETPTHIAVDADGHILVSEIVGTVYQTVRYSEYVPNNAVIRDSANRAVAMQYQVIVRFNENAVNRDAVDGNIGSAESVFGDLEYFLQPNAAQAVRTKLSGQCNTITSINNACPLKLSKVFPLLRTTDTTTISRMGEVIPIPTFWATFVLHLPEGANLQRAMDSLNTLFPTVFFCHANQIGYPTSVPNDHFYNTGGLADLRPTSLYPNGHVNVEPAWDIETGKEHVKVGVFDTGLQWQHEDFGYDGVNPNSSRVVDGWDFDRNSFLKLLPHVEGLNHGTPVAGIIGAVRNNNIGIPGIAGGDAQVGKKGVSLYGLKIYDSGGTDNNLPMSTIANAIVTSTIEPNRIRFRPYSYGLHIMNHSWLVGGVRPGSTPISPTNVKLLEDAVHFVNRAKVTFVNCRGNEGRDDVGDRAYPALFNDDWLICVGGTGTNGLYSTSALPNRNSSNTSSYGKTVDIAGPTSELLIDGALREGGTA
ncbi:MAG: hypothetical protein RL757_753, partial [Bacteroidota bacterium]